LQNLFPPKANPVNAQQKKKRGKKSKRSGEERKQKVKDKGAAKLSRNFAFCACPNFESCNLASGMKASLTSARLVNNVLDSFDSFWLDSDLKMA